MRLGPSLHALPGAPMVALMASFVVVGCFEDVPTDTGQDPTSGTTAATATAGTEGTADGASTGAAADVCPEYCGLVQDVCTDERAQYSSEEICLGLCAVLPPGTADDQLGNTAGCRRFQAVQAAEAPDTFCGAAGPTGGGVCGAQCEALCGLAMAVCTDGNAQWPDIPSCLADCMQFPTEVEYNSAVVAGDSYACRMYHLTVASLDPGVHCPHIGAVSATCV